MKKNILCCLTFVLLSISCYSFDFFGIDSTAHKTDKTAEESASRAMSSVEIPVIKNFQERKMVAKWYKTWDTPSVMTYIYIVSYGTVLGYYVCNGKPISTQSYLIPEDYSEFHSNGGTVIRQAQDLDGTYGSNNPGIRFFTASGIAVEWGGSGASYLFSNAKLPLSVPKLGD